MLLVEWDDRRVEQVENLVAGTIEPVCLRRITALRQLGTVSDAGLSCVVAVHRIAPYRPAAMNVGGCA
jgi:hypothetical protein